MLANEVISLQDHQMEVQKLASTIDRLNTELSALAAYLIASKPKPQESDPERAATLAARLGRITRHEAGEHIRRIEDALGLAWHA